MKARAFLLLGLILCLGQDSASASTALVSDDAFTSTMRPNVRRGALPILSVGPRDTSYIKFDLSALPDGLTANQVAKATLRLWVERVTHGGLIKIFAANSEWSELTITPPFSPTLEVAEAATISFSDGRRKFYVTVDVTSLVREWVTGQRVNHGVALKSETGAGAAQFDSKENAATSHDPTLEIVLAGPKGDTGNLGNTGSEGPQGPPGVAAELPTGSAILLDSTSEWEGYTYAGTLEQWASVPGPNVSIGFPCFVSSALGVHILGGSGGPQMKHYIHTTEGEWREEPTVPGIDVGAAVIEVNGRVYMFGGEPQANTASFTNLSQYFDVSTKVWTTIAPIPTARTYATAIGVGGRIFVLGGYNGNPLASVEVYDIALNAWQTSVSLPTASYPVGGFIGGKIIVTNVGNGGFGTFQLNSSEDGWVTLDQPEFEANGFAATLNEKLYVVNSSKRIFEYDPQSSKWKTIPTTFPSDFISLLGVCRIGGRLGILTGPSPSFLYEFSPRPMRVFIKD